MQNLITVKGQGPNVELTRHQGFLDGDLDMFDVLATVSHANRAKKPVENKGNDKLA